MGHRYIDPSVMNRKSQKEQCKITRCGCVHGYADSIAVSSRELDAGPTVVDSSCRSEVRWTITAVRSVGRGKDTSNMQSVCDQLAVVYRRFVYFTL